MSRRAGSRTYNTRLIKRDVCYTADEIAELFQRHINSVRLWFTQGLRVIDDKRPLLVHGSDLIRFLKNKQAARRRTCAPSEFYCFGCRLPRRSRANQITIENQSEGVLRLRGICEICGTVLFKAGSIRWLDEYHQIFAVQWSQDTRLTVCGNPADNCDLETENIP